MKISILILLGLYLTASLAADECKNHKAYQKAKAFIKDLASNHSKDASDSTDKFATYFESRTPSTSSAADDLGVCSQYQGHQSCCDAKMAKFIEKSALFKNNIIKKLLNGLVRLIGKQSCTALQGITKPATIDDLINNTNLPLLQKLLSKNKVCKVKFATSMVQFTRGAACTICAGVDQISTLFDDKGNLIISEASANEFQNSVTAALQCFKDLVSWSGAGSNDSLELIVKEVTGVYVDQTCQNSIVNKFSNIFTNNGGVSAQGTCKATTVFSKQQSCDEAQQGDSTIDTQTNSNRRFLNSMGFENIRVLQVASDSTTSSSGGANIFISSTQDSSIDADGNANVSITDPNTSFLINSFLASSIALLLLIIY